MDKINIDNENEIYNLLQNIQKNINNISTKVSTFIYGENGIGKTTIIKNTLKKLKYNIYEFDILSQKNKNIAEFYQEYSKQNRNIMDIFHRKNNIFVILIDNVDLINSIDKNTITSLIKIIRPKKNKKTIEINNRMQIIIIGNNDNDKKIKELIKISNVVKIKEPSYTDIYNKLVYNNQHIDKSIIEQYLNVNKNINYYLISKFNEILISNSINNFNKYSTDNNSINNVKHINYHILKNRLDFNDYNNKINDTDKTTVSLLFHENIIDYIDYKHDKDVNDGKDVKDGKDLKDGKDVKYKINIYKEILQNYCFGDYMDRIIFQKQLWQLNEISFKIKVVNNNNIYHNYLEKNNINVNIKLNNIRFTKILTKYSSEFNNYTFINNICQIIDIDKKDLILLFTIIKNNYTQENINYLFNKYSISTLDINRLIKYISIYSYYEY